MSPPDPEEDSDRLRLLRAGLTAFEPLLETDRLTLWRILSRTSARLVRGLIEEGDSARVETAWRAHKAALEQGQVVRAGDTAYHPLRVDGALVGFLRACGPEVTLGAGARSFLARVLDDVARALLDPDVARPAPLDIDEPRPLPLLQPEAAGGAPSDAAGLRALKQAQERALLLRALRACGWDFAKTGRRLGLARSTVTRQAKRFAITRPWRSPKDRRRD